MSFWLFTPVLKRSLRTSCEGAAYLIWGRVPSGSGSPKSRMEPSKAGPEAANGVGRWTPPFPCPNVVGLGGGIKTLGNEGVWLRFTSDGPGKRNWVEVVISHVTLPERRG